MSLIRLTNAENLALNIPAHSVKNVQGVLDQNPNFPDAKTLIRYNIGQGMTATLLLDDPASVVRQILADDKGRQDWIPLNMGDAVPIYILPDHITAVSGIDPARQASDFADQIGSVGIGAQRERLEALLSEARAATARGCVARVNFNVEGAALYVDVVETPNEIMQLLEPKGADGATPPSLQKGNAKGGPHPAVMATNARVSAPLRRP